MTQQPDDLVERLKLIAAWRKPGGPTPKENQPSTHKAVAEAVDRIETLAATITALRQRVAELEEALTPSGDTKAAYMGEFHFNVEIENVDFEDDEDESDINPRTLQMEVPVPWTTIKEIMAAIRKRSNDHAD